MEEYNTCIVCSGEDETVMVSEIYISGFHRGAALCDQCHQQLKNTIRGFLGEQRNLKREIEKNTHKEEEE